MPSPKLGPCTSLMQHGSGMGQGYLVSDTSFPQWKSARLCWVWLPTERCHQLSPLPLWVYVFQQEVTKVTKSAFVSLRRFASFWHILVLHYLLTTASALVVPGKESALYLAEGNHPSSFPRSQKLPQLRTPPSCSRSSLGWELTRGGCKRYLTHSVLGI